MLSNVKKKDVPLIAISLAAIVFIAATLSLFPQQTAQAADSIFNGVTRLLGSTVQAGAGTGVVSGHQQIRQYPSRRR
jgi:BCCT family betaine/carnitine transporter